jgi:hypothetical protein
MSVSGSIIKGIDHIFPNLKDHLNEVAKINERMFTQSRCRDSLYDLWGIGDAYANKELFSLYLEIRPAFRFFPITPISLWDIFSFRSLFYKGALLSELPGSFYFRIIL